MEEESIESIESQIEVSSRRLKMQKILKSTLMEVDCEASNFLKSLLSNVICEKNYTLSELTQIVLSAMSEKKSFDYYVRLITNDRKGDTLLDILKPLFFIKIVKYNSEFIYKLTAITFSDSKKIQRELEKLQRKLKKLQRKLKEREDYWINYSEKWINGGKK